MPMAIEPPIPKRQTVPIARERRRLLAFAIADVDFDRACRVRAELREQLSIALPNVKAARRARFLATVNEESIATECIGATIWNQRYTKISPVPG